MKTAKAALISLATTLALASAGVSAQIAVQETSDDALRVIDYSGKPPYKRRLIQEEERESYTRYATMEDSVLVATSATRRAGPPGKSLPAQQARIERVPESEITRFARFEETESDERNVRRWRGAPGKGRPLAR